ncbi:MAG: EscU/YscU/HrcU family type III secretion system export apparatus switch protein [Clostridiales bacterium]|nr:EscU/YscU/HrcU family type III secretion system export apparatus switch protein [Clostridiales bacterium]
MSISRNYLKDFLKSKLIFVSVLITALALTLMLANTSFGLRDIVFNTPNVTNFAVICTFVYLAIIFIFMITRLAFNKINITDAFALAIFLTGLIHLVYIIVTKTFADNHRLFFFLAHIAFGGWYLFTRFFVYKRKYIRTRPIKTNFLKRYYQELFNKFNVLPLVIFSLLLSCVVCILSYTPTGDIMDQLPLYIVALLCFLPFIVAMARHIVSKTITVADGFAFSSLIQMPIVFAFLFYVNFSPILVIIWAIAFALLLVFTFFRFLKFDAEAKPKKKINKSNYIKLLFSLYTPYAIIGIGTFLALSLMLISKTNVLNVLSNGATLDIYSFFGLILTIFLLAVIIALVVLTFYGRDDEETHLVDFGILVLTVFSICGFATLFISLNQTAVIAMSIIMLYTLLMLRYRSRMFETLD